jgi:hypothetical protein
MSQTSPPAASRSNYQAIFDSALEAYVKKTGKDLTSDPLLHRLEACNSPDAVLTILRAQILEPGQPQSSCNRLTMWLDPTVNVLNAFSATVGALVGQVSLGGPGRDLKQIWSLILILEAYPPVGVIFTGIGILLSVRISIDFSSKAIVTSLNSPPRPSQLVKSCSSTSSSA